MEQINTIAKTALMDFNEIANSNNDTFEKIRLQNNLLKTHKIQCEQLISKSLREDNYQDSLNAMVNLCWLAGLNLNDMISIAVSEFKMSDAFQHIPTFSSQELPTSMHNVVAESYEEYSVSSEKIRQFVVHTYLAEQSKSKFAASYDDICDAFEEEYGSSFTDYEKTIIPGEKSPRWKRRISNLSKTWEKDKLIVRPKRGVYKLSPELILKIFN